MRLQVYLFIQVGGLEEVGAGHLMTIWGDDRADPCGSRDNGVAVVLDGPDFRESQLLLAHRLANSALLVGTASSWAPLRTDSRAARSKITSQHVVTPTV